MATLFQIFTCYSWSSFYFVWQCNAHVWCSTINSGFKHTVSFQNIFCTVHGCPVIVYILVLHYAHTYIVSLYLHSDMFCWRPPKRQNIAWLYKHMHSVGPVLVITLWCSTFSIFVTFFECPFCFVCFSRSFWSSLWRQFSWCWLSSSKWRTNGQGRGR